MTDLYAGIFQIQWVPLPRILCKRYRYRPRDEPRQVVCDAANPLRRGETIRRIAKHSSDNRQTTRLSKSIIQWKQRAGSAP